MGGAAFGGDRVDHGAAVAEGGGEGFGLREGGEGRAAAVAGCAAPDCDEVICGGVA
jgi:hypothetical protein